jgi:hypothetical protein
MSGRAQMMINGPKEPRGMPGCRAETLQGVHDTQPCPRQFFVKSTVWLVNVHSRGLDAEPAQVTVEDFFVHLECFGDKHEQRSCTMPRGDVSEIPRHLRGQAPAG